MNMPVLTTILATRRAPPAQQPHCGMCSGWEHRRRERRPAGAGLGTTVGAKGLATLAGQQAPWMAASTIVTADDGEGRPRGWRAPWGPPEDGSQPLLEVLMLIDAVTIGIRIRREEKISLARTIGGLDVGAGKLGAYISSSSLIGMIDGAARDRVVTAAARRSWMPQPSTPPPRPGHPTQPSATATGGRMGQEGRGQPPSPWAERKGGPVPMAVVMMAAVSMDAMGVRMMVKVGGKGRRGGTLVTMTVATLMPMDGEGVAVAMVVTVMIATAAP